MPTWPMLHKELKAGFPFPEYYGWNIHALKDCLTDADVLDGDAIVVQISSFRELLVTENMAALDCFVECLKDVGDELSKPDVKGNTWDREAIPFHVLVDSHDVRLTNVQIMRISDIFL
jgi:RNAse (barnase) inhibitor barstar